MEDECLELSENLGFGNQTNHHEIRKKSTCKKHCDHASSLSQEGEVVA